MYSFDLANLRLGAGQFWKVDDLEDSH